jgi:hypothetical protein
MTYKIEHDWGGLIRILAPDGSLVATLEKHASGRPGSGTSVHTHAKLQGGRAELMAAALNGPAMDVVAKEAEVDPWAIIDKLRLQHSQEIHDVWMPLVAELRETAMQAEGALAAIQRISDRVEGLWYDPYGDLESDVRSVIAAHAEGSVHDLDGGDPSEDEEPSAPAMR